MTDAGRVAYCRGNAIERVTNSYSILLVIIDIIYFYTYICWASRERDVKIEA